MDNFVNFDVKSHLGWTNFTFNEHISIEQFLEEQFNQIVDDVYVLQNGRRVDQGSPVQNGASYHVIPRLPGGKGGFGSMLRAIGAQIEKTTNREACRDLSGRRMRDVNNEKNLREWVGKQAEREKEKEEKRRERMERRRAVPKHHFDDPQYEQQKSKVLEDLDDAIHSSLSGAGPSTSTGGSTSRKRKATATATATASKRTAEWLGMDLDDSDLDSSEDEAQGGNEDDEPMAQDSGNDNSAAASDSGLPSTSAQESDSAQQSDSDHPQISEQRHSEHQTSDNSPQSDTKNTETKEVTSDQSEDSEPVEKDSEKACSSDSEKSSDQGVSQTESCDQDKSDSNVSQSGDQIKCGTEKEILKSDVKEQEPETSTESQNVSDTGAAPSPKALSTEEVDKLESLVEVEGVGLESLKLTLMGLGLKCGGTLTQRAERLWAIRGLPRDKWNPALLAKPAKRK